VKEVAMQSTYRIHADELTDDFVQAIKVAYRDREIEIIISDDVDETDYLMSTPANRDHLLRAIENIKNHTNLVQMSSDDL
jgi:antitoxin YefM